MKRTKNRWRCGPGWKHSQDARQIRFDAERSKLERMVLDIENADEDEETVELALCVLRFYKAEHPYGTGAAFLLSKSHH